LIQVKKVNGITVEKYLWAGLIRLLAVYDGNDNVLHRFEYADGRMPVAMSKGGATYYLAYDQVGSLRAVSDASGNMVKQIDYDSFGNIITDFDPAFAVPFGFAGGLHDRDTGLVKFGHRDYDPAIGRWVAKDPIFFAGGDIDLYGYVENDPVNFVDPWGLLVQVHSRNVGGTLGAGAHTNITVTDSFGVTRTYGSYGVDGQNKVIINNETDQGPNSLPRTSSETIPPPPGMSQDQWDRAVNQAGQGRNLTQRQVYDLWGGDGGNTSGNCHTTTRGIINDAGGSIPPNYNPPGLNPGLHP
jgi:RHS repeat-associated protein